MAKSILQDEKKCFVTDRTDNLQEHHIFGGYNRKNSEKYGLKVWLIMDLHTGAKGVHTGNEELKSNLHKIGQKAFEEKHSHELFMKVFHKNYL